MALLDKLRRISLQRRGVRSLLSRPSMRGALLDGAAWAVRYVLARTFDKMGGGGLRDLPDNVIPFPSAARDLDVLIGRLENDAVVFLDEFEALLRKHEFAESYIAAVRPVFLEGYMNGDAKPAWFDPDDPGKDIDDA